MASIVGGITTYQHTDHLGSPIRRTNTSGTETGMTLFAPYGSLVAGTVGQGPGFTGHVNDTGSGLVYMQQRHYDPIAMRFVSADPVHVDTATGGNFNRYWYANNNPYRYVDPDGRYSCEGSRQDCKKVDQYVGKIREASRSDDLRPRERAQVRAVSSYLGRKGGGGPKITPANLPRNTKASTDQRGNIKIDVSKSPSDAIHGAMALGHEAQHDIDAKVDGEARTREVATDRERNAYRVESLIGRAHGVILSPVTIEAGVRGSIENVFGPEPGDPDEIP